MTPYRTKPLPIPGLPPGIPYIVGNEAAERFSYYGMRAVLVVFMSQYLMNPAGSPDPMSEEEAKGYFHLFVSATYFTPILGALLADGWLGKYRTIIVLSLVYCLGHLALALDDTRAGLLLGQSLIALGAGGIKPCVSAHVGDQFAETNRHLLSRVYSWFYFAINLGAFTSMLVTPWLLEHYGPSTAFAVPGILMLIATVIFWSGRYQFAHIPAGGVAFLRETLSHEGLRSLAKLGVIYAFVAMFWALFDQTGSSWVLQAQKMEQTFMGYRILPSQIQAANPLLIMILTPLFYYGIYPRIERRIRLTALRKIGTGMFLAALSFALAAWIQRALDAGATPSIGWQLLNYVVLTASEVMVSITCLEFSYTQAPPTMKSFVMSFFMVSVAAGNLFTSAVNFFIRNPDGTSILAGADYFWFFSALMLATAALFSVASRYYPEASRMADA
ncbi:POT family MFS transporter [Methylocaldum sp.]|uniref:POT family MFS transporter n=1 Tax=Methylocaldum sp. TaxID=1969727 RepID=UPI002D27A501|nr:POT family MFS transporter [Methylocaldum sp.]HYE33955.1 POT family MFS transporter [Methylocaldum sp.]